MDDTPRRQHVRRSREAWQRLLDAQASSGQSQRDFCQQRSIGLSSFQYWKRRLRASAPEPSSWIDLGQLTTPSSHGWEIELDLGDGLCLRLRRC